MFNLSETSVSSQSKDLWTNPLYLGLRVYTARGPLLTRHLAAIHRTLMTALADSPRCYSVRFDLRLPSDFDTTDTEVITRFFRAFNRLLESADLQKVMEGKRVHPYRLHYCWVREWGSEGLPHYHVAIMLNLDRYRTLGSFAAVDGNLSARIKQAWSIALHNLLVDSARLVHFPKNAEYRLLCNSQLFEQGVQDIFYRLSYFAKAETKRFGINQRSFGASLTP